VAGERVDRDQEAARLHRAIAKLSSDDAALLVLTAVEGWTTARAADAIGIRPDAARTRLTRIRRRVRAHLENEGDR
jgi:RNA polymerase sigma-70 factor (ECF subfamily)